VWFAAGSRPIKPGGQNQPKYTTPSRFMGITDMFQDLTNLTCQG